MGLGSIFRFFSSDLAIDLGTANTLVLAKNKGVVVYEPSIVAINKITGKVEAVGKEAKEMVGRTPGNIIAIRPMKDGVIADFESTENMLDYFIKKAHNRNMWVRPRIVIGVPSGITQVEKRAVRDAAYRARATEVYLVEEAMAAAIGAGSADHRTMRKHDCRYRRRYNRCGSHLACRHCLSAGRSVLPETKWMKRSFNTLKRNTIFDRRTDRGTGENRTWICFSVGRRTFHGN